MFPVPILLHPNCFPTQLTEIPSFQILYNLSLIFLPQPTSHLPRIECCLYIQNVHRILQHLQCSAYTMMASLMAQMVRRLSMMQETRFNPWVGKISWRRKWQPTPVSRGRRNLVGYSPWGLNESDMTERLHFLFFHLYLIFGHTLFCSNFSMWPHFAQIKN